MLCCSCRQLLSTTIVQGCSRSTIIIVQSLLTTKSTSFFHQLLSILVPTTLEQLFVIIIHCSIFSHSHWLRAYDEFFVFCWWREHMTNNYRICHVLTPSELFVNVYNVQNRKYTFDLRFIVYFNFHLHG